MSDIPTVSGPDYPMGDGQTSLPVIKGYKIIKQLGEGGMGIVYLAEQTEHIKRQVALKIVKPGMDTRAVIGRFEAERQALALLDHPNIAHVYDAGTTDKGRPYFVMEYINGIPITDFCDQQELSLEERLELFKDVCEGIQHAHQRGIIHRDIKPSNILILSEDGKATPKVIDFGIAKAIKQELTEQTMFTAHGQLIGTPEYMSPEQADLTSFNIDTRTDVYSLGVILYQLLTGALPFDPKTLRQAAFGEIQRIIKEVDPPKPSTKLLSLGEGGKAVAKTRKIALTTLTKKLHKELEWIPLKAMRKESEHRYQSVSELASDIDNYLNGSPLIAGPESRAYQIKKYIRRNRVFVTSATLIVLVLIIGITVSAFFAVKAQNEKRIALQNEEAAKEAKIEALKQQKHAEENAELNRQQLYFTSIAQASAACNRNNIMDAQDILDRCPEDLRGWEWFHLRKKTGNAKLIFSGGKYAASSVAYSPDGTMIAWGGERIQLLNVDENTKTIRKGSKSWTNSIVFSPDSRKFASGESDGRIKVWDIQSGNEILNIVSNQGWIRSVAFDPDGKWIASGGEDGTIKIWDTMNGTKVMILSEDRNSIYSISFNPNGSRIVSGSQLGTIKIWDTKSGRKIITFPRYQYLDGIGASGYRDYGVESVAFSPDGRWIVSGDTYGTIKIWDAMNGSEVITISDLNTKNIFSMNRWVVSGGTYVTNKVWNLTSGSEEMPYSAFQPNIISKKRTYGVYSVAFSPDGASIISAIGDGTIRIWDSTTGNPISVIPGHNGGVGSVAFSPDGTWIVSGGKNDGKVRIRNTKSEPEVLTINGHRGDIKSIAFNPNGTRIISGGGDGTVKIWDSQNYSLLKKISPHLIGINPITYKISKVLSVAFSSDGRAIASSNEDGMIRIINIENSTEILTLVGDKSGVNSIAFSPDGKKIISGEGSSSNPGTIRVWNIETGEEILSFLGSKYGVRSVAVSPNGKWLASSFDALQVKLWNLETNAEIMNLERHQGQVNSVLFSPDSTQIAVGHGDGIIKIWNTESGAELLTLNGFQGSIESIAFSPNGKRIASGGELGTIKIWDTKTGSEALTLAGHEADVSCITFSPDESMIVSGDTNGIIKLWKMAL